MSTEYGAAISSPPDTIDDAQDFFDSVWLQQSEVDPRDRMAMETAFSELVSNIIQSNADVECFMRIRISPEALVLSTSDSGEPFDRAQHLGEFPDELAETGRGLPLMELLTDEVTYERRADRNEWVLLRRRSSPTKT